MFPKADIEPIIAERHQCETIRNGRFRVFAGSDEGGGNWSVIATLIENRKLSGINPQSWLTKTLTRLANGHPAHRVGELKPWTAVG